MAIENWEQTRAFVMKDREWKVIVSAYFFGCKKFVFRISLLITNRTRMRVFVYKAGGCEMHKLVLAAHSHLDVQDKLISTSG